MKCSDRYIEVEDCNDRFKFRVWNTLINAYEEDGFLLDVRKGKVAGQNTDIYILEQCTGLRDRNGKLIYEGDVVKCDIDFVPDGRVGLIRRVVFKDGAFQLISEDGSFYFIMGFHNIEIIGNVHEGVKNEDCDSES